jgi:hypothetical protein
MVVVMMMVVSAGGGQVEAGSEGVVLDALKAAEPQLEQEVSGAVVVVARLYESRGGRGAVRVRLGASAAVKVTHWATANILEEVRG